MMCREEIKKGGGGLVSPYLAISSPRIRAAMKITNAAGKLIIINSPPYVVLGIGQGINKALPVMLDSGANSFGLDFNPPRTIISRINLYLCIFPR